ncbi:MAG: extracellular solute-binding protein [Planctomycetes bacterium]|nr:extracellular solute-binding protein [Planctomycetota bacterium]
MRGIDVVKIRYHRIALVLLGVVACTAACGKPTPASSSDGRAVVRLLPWFEDYHWLDPLLQRFAERHPEIEVRKLQASQEEETLRTLIAAGDAPDVFAISYEALDGYRDAAALEPLDESLAAAGVDLDRWFPRTLEALRRDGRLYGLPKDCTPYVFFYDVAAFEQAGLARPSDEEWTWERLREYARRLTVRTQDGEVERYGLLCNLWVQAFLPWVWQAGGDLLAPVDPQAGGLVRSALADGPAARALEFLVALRADGSHPPFAQPEIHSTPRHRFGRGTIAMVGPTGRWSVQALREEFGGFRYDVLPLPRGPAGNRDTALAMTAWCVSSTARNKAAALTLLRFLAGEDGARFMGELGRAVPAIRTVADEILAADAAQMPVHGREVFTDGLARLRIAASGGARHAEIKQALTNAVEATLLAADGASAATAIGAASAEVDAILARGAHDASRPRLPLALVLGASALAWGAGLLGLLRAQRTRDPRVRRERRAAFAFLSPWLLGATVFVVAPLVVVVALAFSDWNALRPIGDARFVGLEQFTRLFTDARVARSLAVTATYAALAIPLQLVVALALALLLWGAGRRLGVMRAVVYLPSLIAGVAMSVLWWRLFDTDGGLFNDVLRAVGLPAVPWLTDSAAVIPSFAIMSLWYVGGTVVVFLAGLATVPHTLLEAARLDGAGPWARLRHVILPWLAPLVLFNAVTLLIGSFQTFTQSFVLTKGGPNDASLFYVLNLYRTAFSYQEMGYACAQALLLLAIVGVAIAIVLRAARRGAHAV